MEGLNQLLQSNNFAVSSINPAVEEIGEEVDVLLWIAPINDPDEQVLERLERFLSENEEKTLLYFADTTQPQLSNLESFFWSGGEYACSQTQSSKPTTGKSSI